MRVLQKDNVAELISNIEPATVRRYSKYWRTIAPTTMEDRYRRWLFSFLSVQTGWEKNVELYKAVTTIPWNSKEELHEIIGATRCGCFTAKTEGIWNFHKLYIDGLGERLLAHPRDAGWMLPAQRGKRRKPNWQAWRDRLVALVDDSQRRLLQYARHKVVSFAHEMCWPTQVGVVAIDTHVAKWYGLTTDKLSDKLYVEIESHWLEACERVGYPPDIVRHILWDRVQNKSDTRYWSHVFEQDVAATVLV